MSALVIAGDTSGTITIEAPAVAGTNTLTLPASSGTLLDSTSTLDATLLTGDLPAISGANLTGLPGINSGTAVASTSGTSIDFTGIPSGTKRITMMLFDVSTNGANDLIIQIGNGSIVATGYNAQRCYTLSSSANASTSVTTCIAYIATNNSSDSRSGQIVLTNLNGNTWVATGLCNSINAIFSMTAGSITLGGVLDRIRLTTTTGTNTFDAGSINILYE